MLEKSIKRGSLNKVAPFVDRTGGDLRNTGVGLPDAGKEFLFKLVIYGMDVCNEVVAGRVAGGNHRT